MDQQVQDLGVKYNELEISSLRILKKKKILGGAWIPKIFENQYLQINLGEIKTIYGFYIAGSSISKDRVTSLEVTVSDDDIAWSPVNPPIFRGPKVSKIEELNLFSGPFEAQYIRFYPLTWSGEIAMRVEIVGCSIPTPTPVPTSPKPPICDEEMGLENGDLGEDQIQVSSVMNEMDFFYGKGNVRLNNKVVQGLSGGAWVAKPSSNEYIRIFSANYDSSTPIENTFDRLIETRYLEIRPVTWNVNIAMRIEIKGCFKPYPQTKPTPTPTKAVLPPPYCEACPNLPPEYFDKCYPCQKDEKFDGENCVPEIICPCYHEGGERPVQTPSCKCVCKPCPENTRLCPSNDFCLEDKKWCDGIENCPNDEVDCPTLAPPECPIPKCPEEWELNLEIEGDDVVCPQYTCQPPDITTPMSCPSPLCPFGYNIILVPKKSYGACPKYECEAPETTLEPYTCPPPTCPNGYEIEVAPGSYDQYSQTFGNYEQHSYDESDGCPQFKCVTNAPPTAPCSPPNCPQGYDVYYPDRKDLLSLCPTYECVPIVTTTPCPPVECPKGLHTLFVQTDGELCPQYTCIKITTPSVLTTPTITDMPCREVALPVCEPGEEIYQANPFDICPIFKCKKIGSPPPTTMAPKVVIPTCELKNKDFTTFDGTEYHMDICHHILVRDKIAMEWQISIHQNCTQEPCERFLRIKENNSTLILSPDLTVLYDGHSYSISQVQKIGQTSKIFTISKLGDSIVYKSESRNYSVIWNVETDLKIEISDNAIYQVDGLCGFFSGSPVDDRTKPDGSLAATTKEFGDAWSMPEGDCKKPPKKCSPEENKKAFILCNALDSKPFTECHDVLPVEHYLKGCVDRLCVCLKENKTEEECKCGVLASYITACLEKKPDANVADWRICPPGEIYNDCYKSPCEKTCDNLNDAETCSQTRNGPCVSGCFCEPGLVRKGDTCVVPESCRDCICEGYGDPHFKSFDRKNFTFNGECPYVAARDVDPTGKHQFQVINSNKRCQKDPVTMCTESVQVLYNDHDILIKLLPTDSLVTTIDGLEISTFPLKEDWIDMENPDDDRNCNFDTEDDFRKRDGTVVESVKEFGLSWVSDTESDSACQVFEKEDIPCIPPHPDVDPCLKLMDKDIFGECHPLEDPVAYLSSCQLDLCLAIDPENSACQSLEAYARRCSQLGVCLNWRSDELCPKSCPEHLEYVACGPGCVKTCDNYEELKKNPKSCLISSSDGCYCPNNMVLDNKTCVNESACATCDAEGHRVGDVWKTDNCTVCECSNGAAICKTTTCPLDPVCNEGYVIEEVPDTFDECCGFQKTCKIKPLTNCVEPLKPSEDCGYGKRLKLIEAPGVCPEYACVCVDPEDCPALELPKKEDLKPGEEWVLESKGCCPRYVPSCTGECPSPDCQEFYEPFEKPMLEGQCCPEYDCVPPQNACIFEPQYVVENGYERPLKDEEKTEKKLFQVGEKWMEGLCIECECSLNTENKPVTKCLRKTCTKIEEHPDRKAYVLKEIPVPNTCCPKIDRISCIDDYEEFKENETYIDPINACRSVECKRNGKGTLEKVEQISSCDENCALGWKYEPSPLAPLVCCGGCEQIACEYNGVLKEVGETWYSEDLCTVYECIRDESQKIQTRGKEIQCGTPSEEERSLYLFKDSKSENTCCSTHTRVTCLLDGKPMEPGQEVIDPNDKCMRILCEKTADGNVTRKEKEQACNRNCPLGHVYMEAPSESEECCGTCIQTQCVDKDVIHPIGEIWENPKDICYQYKCDMRDDTLTVLAIKRDCPYFDPECPPTEILMDPTGCCKICNITRETKRECQPEEIDPRDTIGIEARHISECFCCQPSRMSQIEVVLKCNRGYSFQRVFDNIESCECQPCQSLQRDDQYVKDQPLSDLTEFIPMNDEGSKSL
ncbi:Hemocytin [Armadillidium vulgare]|nr:Hemocytin [Armadillidium vulgare]